MKAIDVYRSTVQREGFSCYTFPLPNFMLVNIGHTSLYINAAEFSMTTQEYDEIMELAEEALSITHCV